MNYFCCLLILTIIEFCHYKIAKKRHIFAPIQAHSSHTENAVTSGGLIFPIAAIFFAAINFKSLNPEWLTLIGGAIALGIVSFIDDAHPLPAKPRLLMQIAVISMLFTQPLLNSEIILYLMIVFCGVGFVNAYNFIDGINGILSKLTAVVIVSLICAYMRYMPENTNLYIELGYYLLMAIAVFMMFNMQGKVFAGDVGSITIGLFIVWMLFNLCYSQRSFATAVLSSVCLFDTGLTAIQRLFTKENILKPHRKHIYQILTLRHGLSHSTVSTAYATLQLTINIIYLVLPQVYHTTYAIMVSILLTIIYISIRKSPKSGKFNENYA